MSDENHSKHDSTMGKLSRPDDNTDTKSKASTLTAIGSTAET